MHELLVLSSDQGVKTYHSVDGMYLHFFKSFSRPPHSGVAAKKHNTVRKTSMKNILMSGNAR